MMSPEEQLKIIRSGAEEIIPEAELLKKLEKSVRTGQPLRVKQGFDPTAPDIHLGHAVGLRKLRQFQELGHTVVLIVGDYTAMVGDPTDRSSTRPRLTHAQVEDNARTYLEQFFRILDRDRTEVRRNGDWFAAMPFDRVMDLAARFTVARMLERDDFARRFKEQRPISLHEMFYPIMQGYDSVEIRSDVELGATEQKFNLLVGRQLQQDFGQEPQVILTLPILVGLDGVNRMSKSLGNYVGITDPPTMMFGKLMSLPDDRMLDYFTLATDATLPELALLRTRLAAGNENPRNLKVELAQRITGLYHSAEIAETARREFDRVFSQGGVPDDIPEIGYEFPADGAWIIQLITDAGMAPSRNEARRLVKGAAVTVDGITIKDEESRVVKPGSDGILLKVGKRRFARIRPR